jgi:hypothetical protein
MQKNEVEKEISELKIQQQYLLRAGDQNDNLVKENKKTAHNINMYFIYLYLEFRILFFLLFIHKFFFKSFDYPYNF